MCTFGNQFLVLVPEFCWVTHKKGSELRFWIRNCVWLSKIQALELRTGSQKCTCKQAKYVPIVIRHEKQIEKMISSWNKYDK